MSSSREICKICLHINSVGFDVPDKIWKSVVPLAHQNNVVCLSCFTRLADEKMIDWDSQIEFYPVSMKTHLKGAGT